MNVMIVVMDIKTHNQVFFCKKADISGITIANVTQMAVNRSSIPNIEYTLIMNWLRAASYKV